MATTTPAIEEALAVLRQRRLTLFEASRARNNAMRQKVFDKVPPLNDQIAVARAAWFAARAAVVAALLELEEP